MKIGSESETQHRMFPRHQTNPIEISSSGCDRCALMMKCGGQGTANYFNNHRALHSNAMWLTAVGAVDSCCRLKMPFNWTNRFHITISWPAHSPQFQATLWKCTPSSIDMRVCADSNLMVISLFGKLKLLCCRWSTLIPNTHRSIVHRAHADAGGPRLCASCTVWWLAVHREAFIGCDNFNWRW